LVRSSLVFGQDHLLDDRQAFRLEEHVLGAAQADTNRAVGAGALGILGVVGVGPNLQAAAREPSGMVRIRRWRRFRLPR
jgi:hypothetical protein